MHAITYNLWKNLHTAAIESSKKFEFFSHFGEVFIQNTCAIAVNVYLIYVKEKTGEGQEEKSGI